MRVRGALIGLIASGFGLMLAAQPAGVRAEPGVTRLSAPPEQFVGAWYDDEGPATCDDPRGPSVIITTSTVEFVRVQGASIAIGAVDVGKAPAR